MATTTLNPTATLNIASYWQTYENANNADGAVVSAWPWLGQYYDGRQYEVNQLMVAFDPSALTGSYASASLILTIDESYGNTVVQAREHDWLPGAGAWVQGSDLPSKKLLGSAPVGPGAEHEVEIPISAFDLSRPLKFLLAIADQANSIPPTGDTTLLVSASRLVVTTAPGQRPLRSFRWL